MNDQCALEGKVWGLDGTSICSTELNACLWCHCSVCENHQADPIGDYFKFYRCQKCVAKNVELYMVITGDKQSARQRIESSLIAFYEDLYLSKTKAARK